MSSHAPWEKTLDKVVTPFEEFIAYTRTCTSTCICLTLAGFGRVRSDSKGDRRDRSSCGNGALALVEHSVSPKEICYILLYGIFFSDISINFVVCSFNSIIDFIKSQESKRVINVLHIAKSKVLEVSRLTNYSLSCSFSRSSTNALIW